MKATYKQPATEIICCEGLENLLGDKASIISGSGEKQEGIGKAGEGSEPTEGEGGITWGGAKPFGQQDYDPWKEWD